MSGYVHCECGGCFDVTIASSNPEQPALCELCEEAGCEPECECQREDAYDAYKENARREKYPGGLSLVYSRPNQAWFVMQHDKVLRVFNRKDEAEEYALELTRGAKTEAEHEAILREKYPQAYEPNAGGRKIGRHNKIVPCRSCGKMTHQDVGGMGLEMCAECIEKSGLENEHSDGYHDDDPHPECPRCQRHTPNSQQLPGSEVYQRLQLLDIGAALLVDGDAWRRTGRQTWIYDRDGSEYGRRDIAQIFVGSSRHEVSRTAPPNLWWTAAPEDYDYNYVDTVERDVPGGTAAKGKLYRLIQVNDPEAFEQFQRPRYSSGLYGSFPAHSAEAEYLGLPSRGQMHSNASRSVDKVIQAALSLRIATAAAFTTAGGIVYSYSLPIGNLRHEDGPYYVLDKRESPSVTTSKHIGYLMGGLPSRQIVVVADVLAAAPPEDLAEEMLEPNASRAEQFFYESAGYSYSRGATKAKQNAARWENARALAAAEAEASDRGWYYEWEEDSDGFDTLGDVPEEDVTEVLTCVLKDENSKVLGVLGGILMGHNSAENRRQARLIETELALEALS